MIVYGTAAEVMRIVAVDVGICNLAYVEVDTGEDNLEPQVNIISTQCIDLRVMQHIRISRSDCALYHSNDACDRVDHFIQDHLVMLERADRILIERQPPVGLVHIEQLLLTRFRSKAQLCSPNTLHKWMGIGHLDYEGRKEKTTQHAETYLSQFAEFKNAVRKHDMADALCFVLWFIDDMKRTEKRRVAREDRQADFERIRMGEISINDWFERFRHSGDAQSLETLTN